MRLILTAVKRGYLLAIVTWLHDRFRGTTHCFQCSPLTSYGIQVIAGPENYISEIHFLKVPDCFTGKYTARKIHKNYIRDPNGLYYRWGNCGNFPLFILSMFFCLYNKKNITRRLEDMNVGTKSLSKGIMIVFKTKGLQIRCIPHESLVLSQCKASCKKHAGWQNLSKDITKF